MEKRKNDECVGRVVTEDECDLGLLLNAVYEGHMTGAEMIEIWDELLKAKEEYSKLM